MRPAELGELEAFRDLYAAAQAGLGARGFEPQYVRPNYLSAIAAS